jgi:hypothetical protein
MGDGFVLRLSATFPGKGAGLHHLLYYMAGPASTVFFLYFRACTQ